ncbi:MAG: IS701 family transposase [Chloroflexota bacterium]
MEMVSETEEQAERTRIAGWAAGLDALHARIAGRFRRTEARRRARQYLEALLRPLKRKNGWQLAEQLGEQGPQGVQRLLTTAHWDADAVRDDLRAYVVEQLGDPEAVVVVDETGFLKKGTKSVGVKRQYSGTAGRIENSQVGVFLAYAAPRGHAFLDRALYLPKEWAADAERRQEAGVPESVRFATKGQLAHEMLVRAFAAGVPAAWVTADEVYGDDGTLRAWLEEQDKPYVLAVSCAHRLWVAGLQERVDVLTAGLPAEAWTRLSCGEGSQGPRLYDWACWRLPAAGGPERAQWVLVRRSLSDPTELAYYRAWGPAATPLAALVRVAGTRWVIEECIERAKGEVGLDQYEVRRWTAWYRYITLALLAHAYLEVTRAQAVTEIPPFPEAGEKRGALPLR